MVTAATRPRLTKKLEQNSPSGTYATSTHLKHLSISSISVGIGRLIVNILRRLIGEANPKAHRRDFSSKGLEAPATACNPEGPYDRLTEKSHGEVCWYPLAIRRENTRSNRTTECIGLDGLTRRSGKLSEGYNRVQSCQYAPHQCPRICQERPCKQGNSLRDHLTAS